MKSLKLLFRMAVLAAGLAYGFVLLDPLADEPEILHLALVGGLDPGSADEAEAVRRGLELYLETLNAEGGVNGRRVVLDVFDDQGNPYWGRRRALEIVRENRVIGVIGHLSDAASLAGGEVYRKYGIPAITPVSSSRRVTEDNDWYFRTVLSEEEEGRFLARYAARVLEVEEVVLLAASDDYGRRTGRAFAEAALASGVRVRARIEVDPATDDTAQAIERIVAGRGERRGREAIFVTDARVAVRLLRRLRDAGLDLGVLAPNPLSRRSFPQAFENLPRERIQPGFYTDGVVVTTSLILDTGGERAQDFQARYAQRYGEPPSEAVFFACDAAHLLLEGARAAHRGGEDLEPREMRRAVREFLAGLRSPEHAVRGLTGLIHFDDHGDSTQPVSVGEYRNNRVTSAPRQLREASLVGSRELRDGLATGRIVELGDRYMYRTDIVYAGVAPIEIVELDLPGSTATLSFHLWLRYRRGTDATAIEFLSAVDEIELGEPVEERIDGDLIYRLYTVRGTFRLDYMRPRELGQHVAAVSFRHRDLAHESLIYVVDGEAAAGGGDLRLRSPDPDWSIERFTVFHDLLRRAWLGNPEYLFRQAEGVEFSRFNAVLEIERERLSLRSLLSGRIATYLLVAGLLVVAIYSGRIRRSATQRIPKLLWMIEALGASLLLLALESVVLGALHDRAATLQLETAQKVFEALWWLLAAVLTNLALVRFAWSPLERMTGRKIPAIVHHMSALLIGVLALFGIVAFVLDQKITGLLATSGVLAMIIGLAIQINISNIFSGIALNLEQPFRVGDWVTIGSVDGRLDSGKVSDITWRSTRLLTDNGTVLSVPNSMVAESFIENFDLPQRRLRLAFEVNVDAAVPPATVERILRDAALSVEGVIADPAPVVYSAMRGDEIAYRVAFYVDDYGRRDEYRSAVSRAAWRYLRRERIAVGSREVSEPPAPETALEESGLLSKLSPDARARLIERVKHRRLSPGEVLIREHGTTDSLFLIARGVASVQVGQGAGATSEIRRIGPGELCGEMSLLTGEPRSASVVALSELEAWEMTKGDLAPLLEGNRQLAADLTELLLEHKASDEARLRSDAADPDEERRNTLRSVRRFFRRHRS